MIKNFILYLFLGLFIPLIGSAQNSQPTFVTEQVLLHTDRQLYLSGETIWFKTYVLVSRQTRLSGFSKIGYLELIDQEGVAIARLKVALENGHGEGTIKLPKTLNSGSYTLRAYTQGLRNSEEKAFGKQTLIILNPAQPIVRSDDLSESYQDFEPLGQTLAILPKQYLNIEVTANQTAYAQRTMATLEIRTTDANGQAVPAEVSLSVALRASANVNPNGLFQKSDDLRSNSFPIPPMTIHYPAEADGMKLNGRVVNSNTNEGEPNVEVYLAFPGKRALVYTVKTDTEGRFSFLLPKLYGLRQVVVQTHPAYETPVRIELADEFHQSFESVNTKPFVLPPEWESLAKASLINQQIGKAYQAFQLEPVFTTENIFAEIPFFGEPEAQYQLDDYTRFPLPEFFFEVVTEVRVKGKFGEEKLAVLNEWQNPDGELEPLLLVDGVPVFDQRTFLKINNQLIASTQVVTLPFWLNPGVYDGVIQITSFEGDARCFTLPERAIRRSFLTLLPQQQFDTPDYEQNADIRLPDFRNTLYWNPLIRTDAEGKATVRFYTSDALGTYDIQVEGVSERELVGTGDGVLQVVKEMK